MDQSLALSGAFWGALSAISLPLGALLGIWLKPPKRVTSALMAFGGGALLFALTIELFGHALHKAMGGGDVVVYPEKLLITMLGAVIGGLLFEGLNRGLDKWGAFMRKRSLLNAHAEASKRAQVQQLLTGLSKARLLHSLPLEEVMELVHHVTRCEFKAGEIVFEEDDPGDAMYFILSGRMDVTRQAGDGSFAGLAKLEGGEVVGEIALFSEHPRTATATAGTDCDLLRLSKSSFDEVLAGSPKLQAAMGDMVGERLEALSKSEEVSAEAAQAWQEQAVKRLDSLGIRTTEADVAHDIEEHGGHGGAAMGIWLGIALDGVPESLVIGMLIAAAVGSGTALTLGAILPIVAPFVVGVFLANLPEAMSSSVTMHRTGMSTKKILIMWGSLVVLTGGGAAIGAATLPADPTGAVMYFMLAVEGLAGGAMLTMIAATMLPEAFEQGGGTIVGMSTLGGFLAALSVTMM